MPTPTHDDAAGDATWAYAWPAGMRLAAELAAVAFCAGRRVLDLGCGGGQCGRAALAAGAREVVFADASPARWSTWLRCCRWRSPGAGARSTTAGGDAPPHGPFDLVLGGDILYRPFLFAELLASVAAGIGRDGAAVLADPRTTLEPELPPLAAAAGLTWEPVRRAGGYTLVRLRRA